MTDKSNDLIESFELFIEKNNQASNNQLYNLNLSSINNIEIHYLCGKCLKFPYIKFCKNKKFIRLNCSCFNNKKILIQDYLQSIEDNYKSFLNSNSYQDNEKGILCKKHNAKFKGFSKIYLKNYCQSCIDNKNNNDFIVKFDNIKIEDKKIEKLLTKINNNNIISNEENDTIIIDKIINNEEDGHYELSVEDEINFNYLIKIIINDYKNYPNYSHFFNIINLLYYFNIEDRPIIEKLEKRIIQNIEPIIIEYNNNNNISNKTKLFSQIFVKNNKNKFRIEIEGKILDLIKEYEFKTKEKKVRIKLYLNDGVSKIDMYKMFANCTDLIYVNGISKLKKIKIINLDKIFYNCISLLSIPDINDWEIEQYNIYLMFYNCISLVFFPYEKELNINRYDDAFLGLIITKYLKYNKEMIINNIIEDNEGYINIFGNKYIIKEEEIMIFNGRDKNILIAYYKDKKLEDKNKLECYNKNKIKLRIINKFEDMNEIIKNKQLDLSKWNTNNITDMS